MQVKLSELVDVNAIRNKVREELGMNEAYVVQAPPVEMQTELLSSKSQLILKNLVDTYAKELNHVSAELEGASRDLAMPDASSYVALKAQEGRLLQLSFLLGLHITNIGDPQSLLTMDSLSYMRIERDFGTFDSWQKDFIACAIGSACFAVTAYSLELRRYINLIVDDNHPLPPSVIPVISLAVMPQLYVRDYLDDRKSYVFAMMKEFNWNSVENRVKRAEKCAAAYEGRPQ
jgi:superoxide dismutase